ncbi:TPA: DUF551 domain-containing protein [Escherichia coli]|nr:DUF551 domain-containing protein [Escherichia coli]EFI8256693.1 DUF551 domain-containing protein [Escherichia coli]EFJ1045203.1 DUF551 domain-containing protein [Escherichia coli]EFO6001761.1 DUF551 domain-containing protein [Escherichia coli]
MTKLTKERLEEIAELARKATYKPCAMHMTNLLVVCDSEVIEEMARQLLASMEQEPVSYTCSDALDDVYCGSAAMMGPAGAVGEVPLYAAPQLPQPAVLSVPDEIPKLKDGMGFKYVKDGVRYSLNYANGWNQCRAAMLQAEPVSNSDELPLDYLQGHKDGLEWAAQLAEANHPQTGDWLYDDPIDLARAIRKGPDMPTVQGGNSPVTPDGWISCSERMPEKNQNVLISVNFDSSLVEPLICSARYTGSTFRRGDATIKPGNGIEQATHWMPLPEPPQEVK